jgi:uncharacterized membrane protein
MPRQHSSGEQIEDPSLARVGAFSDGVFAFAITLLVLAIRVPHLTDSDANRGLPVLLTQQWRSYLAFVLSFMLVGLAWVNHRVMYSRFIRANHMLIWLNLVHLMVIVFTPIPTAVLGEWLGNGQNQVVAAVFYGATATVGAALFNVVWWYGAYVAKLTSPALTSAERRAHTVAWVPAPIIIGVLTLIAFVSPVLAVTGFVAIIVLYLLPTPALVARTHHDR